jgi:hypothetical protein
VDNGSAHRVEEVRVDAAACPDCGGPLEEKGFRERSLIESRPMRAERILCRLQRKYCPRCRKAIQARAPSVLPQGLFGNQLVTQLVFLHYQHGIPVGRICQQLGIGLGTAFAILHRIAGLFQGVIPHLIEEYRRSPVRHADETG